MPRSTREWARRKLKEAVQHIDWTALHLNDIIEAYEKDHPEVADPLKQCISMMLMLVEIIQKTRASF